jgi:hypothetical protein
VLEDQAVVRLVVKMDKVLVAQVLRGRVMAAGVRVSVLAVVALAAVLVAGVVLLFPHLDHLLAAQEHQTQSLDRQSPMQKEAILVPLTEMPVLLVLPILATVVVEQTVMVGLAHPVVPVS